MELHVCDILKSQLQRSAMVDYVFTAENLNYFILVLTIPAVEIVHKWSFSTPNIGVEFLFEIFRPQNFDPYLGSKKLDSAFTYSVCLG